MALLQFKIMRGGCSWCRGYTASFHFFPVKTKHTKEQKDKIQQWIAKTCCISGSHQKLLLWHAHVFVQRGHPETLPAINCVLLAALTRNHFRSEAKSGPAWVPVSELPRASINSKSSAHLLWAHHTLPAFPSCLLVEAVTVTQISPVRFPVQGDSPYIIWHREAIKLLRFISPKLLRFLSPAVIWCWRTWHLKQCNYNLRSQSS